MTDTIERTIWYKLRYTPIRDAVRGRISARMDVRPPIENSGLPPEVKQLLHRVVRKTGLWRLEQVQVAHELIAHFTDGIAAGQTPDELIRNFGDEKLAATLIRRATRRNRPPAWQIARFAGWSTAVLILFYFAYAVYFFSGRPSPRVDYVARIDQAVEKTPVEDRAWPLYRRALVQIEKGSLRRQELTKHLEPQRSKERASLLQYVSEHQAELEWIREGTAKPVFGFLIGAKGSAYDPELWPDQKPRTVDPVSGQWLATAAIPPLESLRNLDALLRADAVLARQANDGKRLLEDIRSLLGLARQIRENAPLIVALVSLSMQEDALSEIEQTLRDDPNLLTPADWTALAQQLSPEKVAADFITLQPERLTFDDILQRAFTDDGSGNGRLTPEGVGFFDMRLRPAGVWFGIALHPAIGLLVPSRQKLAREYAHVAEVAAANFKLPIRNADWQSLQDAMEESRKSFWNSINPMAISKITPAFWHIQATAERFLGRRDGVVVAIALERYRREHGHYPENLNALGRELREIPADRITGEPVRYRVVEGQPVVYSVGADHKDDGGRATNPPQSAATWGTAQPVATGDWILYPGMK